MHSLVLIEFSGRYVPEGASAYPDCGFRLDGKTNKTYSIFSPTYPGKYPPVWELQKTVRPVDESFVDLLEYEVQIFATRRPQDAN